MASAVSKAVMVTEEVPGVLLKMTAGEAQALIDVLALVGGSPENTRRPLIEDISDALERVGYHWSPFDLTGGIKFLTTEQQETF